VLLVHDPGHFPSGSDLFLVVAAAVVGDLEDFVSEVFRLTLARENVQLAKFEGQGALHVVLSLFLHLVAGRRRGGALLSNYPCHSHEYRLFAIRTSAGPRQPLRILIAGNHDEATRGILFVWVIEFIKLLGRRRLHPLNAECPICHQMVRLHYNKAGRRHLLAHARACSLTLYEGARYCVHYTAKIKCLGSGTLAKFDPRPNENQHFKLPKFLELEGWSTSSSERGDVRLRTRTDRQSGHSHSAVP
jgi:hypothetical protein